MATLNNRIEKLEQSGNRFTDVFTMTDGELLAYLGLSAGATDEQLLKIITKNEEGVPLYEQFIKSN